MALIIPAILSLVEHLETLQTNPEVYRPEQCPHCGKAGSCQWPIEQIHFRPKKLTHLFQSTIQLLSQSIALPSQHKNM